MNIINKLSLQNVKLNKKRTIGTIIGIILSVALVTAVAGMFESLQESLFRNARAETGYYHYSISGLDSETLDMIASNRQVGNIIKSYYLGYAKLDRPELKNALLTMRSIDNLEDLPYRIESGRKPQKTNEIIIPASLEAEGNLKVGDTLELDVGVRMTNDGYILDSSNPYHGDNEYLANTKHQTYTIVGTFTGPGSRAYYFTGETSTFYLGITTKETSDKIDAYIALKNPREREKFVKSLYATGKFDTPTNVSADNYTLNTNYELLRWEVFAFSDETITMLYTVVGIVIAIIVISSIFCIRNSFAISITEKSKMLGMLASVGATKKQIKKSVLAEATILGIIGIPLGVLSGILADYILIKIVNFLLEGHLFAYSGGLIFKITFASCLIACILGILTIYFSALKSARRASRISPIDNMRSSKDIVLNSKNLKVPRIIHRIFKTGGVLAYKNLRRSKKKYRTTVISLAVSVFIFIALNSFLSSTFGVVNKYYTTYDYNVSINSIRELKQSEIDALAKMDNIEEFHATYEIMTGKDDYINIYDREYTKKLEEYDTCDEYNHDTQECIGPHVGTMLIGLDDASYKSYVESLGMNYDKVKDKGILVDQVAVYINDKETETRRFTYKKGDTFKGIFHDEDFEVEIGELSATKPYGIENYNYAGGFFIVDKDYFKDIEFTPLIITIKSNNPDKLVKDINSFKKGLVTTNIEEETRYSKALSLVVSIFLYGFITVITLIGVTNIFNTITSNMELRQKEFAMLKSIGMTKKEFHRMINLETLFYSVKALIYGIILGLLGSLLIHNAFNIKSETAFQFPTTAILLSILFVFALVFIIMHFSISKINSQNTIETIRKENI